MGSYDKIRDLHAERQTFLARVLIGFCACLVLLAILLARLIDLQVLNHDYFSTRANDNRMRLVVVPPVRGLIYDRNGTVLAQNSPTYVLELVPEQVRDIDDTLARLGKVLTLTDTDIERFRERLRRSPRYRGVALRTRLAFDEVASFQINRHDFPGVDVHAALNRHYPLGASMAHVVGYVGGITEADLRHFDANNYRGVTHIGKTGVERSFETLLHGEIGASIIETNATGRPLRELEHRPGLPGKNLYLSIDARLQLEAEAALSGFEGAVVALDPRSGEVLALVSLPSFDPQPFVDGLDHETFRGLNENPERPLFNRAIAGTYPPGSTIKPMMAFIGLEQAVFTAEHRVFCPGHFELPNVTRRFRDWKRSGHGWMNLDRSIAESCDVYYYQLAHELGMERIEGMLGEFGLGAPTGIQLPGERAGILPSREWKRRVRNEAWFPGETLNIGIGQGYMTMTPLQMAQMTSRIARRGEGVRPRILRAIEYPVQTRLGAVAGETLPAIEARDARHWQAIINGMLSTLHSPGGTAFNTGRQLPYRLAGKTGTSQVAGLSQEDDLAPQVASIPKHLRDHALFVGFAPAAEPRIAVAVIVEHGGSGGAVAAPIAARIINAWLALDDGDPNGAPP